MSSTSQPSTTPATVPVTFILDDPQGLGQDQPTIELRGSHGQTLLRLALDHDINIEHACGGVCACSTCHVYIEQGMASLSEACDEEEDRVDEAPMVRPNSRLACQCRIEGDGPIVARVPAWNRNAVKETPH
jgi:2Fe-2S ferredoxin